MANPKALNRQLPMRSKGSVCQLYTNFRICPLTLRKKPTYYHMQKINGKLFVGSNSFDVIFSSITVKSLSYSIEQTFSKCGRARLVFPTYTFGTTEAQGLLIGGVAECLSPIYRNIACIQKYSYMYTSKCYV